MVLNRRFVGISVLAIVLVVAGMLLLRKKPEEKRKRGGGGPRKVEAMVVHPTALSSEITVTGTVLANDEVELKNEVAGRIVYLYLPEGKSVRKGTVLVRLFSDDLQADLLKLQGQLAIQQDILNRQSELLKVNGLSRNDYERSLLQVNTLKSEIEAQKAQIRKTQVLAPFDGIVGLRNVSVGAVVNTSTALATLRSSNLKLDFFVPEKYSKLVRAGMEVDFTLSSGTQAFRATVLASERGIDEATRNLRVRARISSGNAELVPGAFTKVNLKMGENATALLVPTESLIPMERDKQVVVAHHGKAHFVTVETGIRQSSLIEVTEGLQPGDTLITSGLLFLKEGDPLQYAHVKAAQ